MSMRNSNETIGNRTRDLPACSTVPQRTALLPAPPKELSYINISRLDFKQAMFKIS